MDKSANNGFTIIELVIVIALIAILSAVAIPKFINLSSSAQTAAIGSIAGTLTSASANNYAARKLSSTLGAPVTNCTDVAATLQGGLPTGYTIMSGGVSADATVTCTLNGPNSSTTTFTAMGIP